MDAERELQNRFTEIAEKIASSAQLIGKTPADITLVAVSKKQSIHKMLAYRDFCRAQGNVAVFGENYVQEFKTKSSLLGSPMISHLIGPLQRNKAALAVELFDVIESIHSPEVAEAVNRAAAKIDKVQDVFLQVNISQDENKSGFLEDEVAAFCTIAASHYLNLNITGLMTITREYPNREDVRPDFAKLHALRNRLDIHGLKISMGMSNDFDIAIQEGADIVRVGSALFGSRADTAA
ncbi:MAG: YggS family pyridoxal phosphate-dependent enzyme [Deltaproteobacteria bacterium]|nr:YggS family pyridoxal phosphate-dependent enzyme [Deltaproteobacteria bacterium]